MEVGLSIFFGGSMKRKAKESKLNVTLTALLLVFVCLLFFSIGVISGKGWSDREYKVRHIENDSHLKAAMEDNEPIGDEMTQKEVELLTQRALEEAKAQQPQVPAPEENENQEQAVTDEESNNDQAAVTSQDRKDRSVASQSESQEKDKEADKAKDKKTKGREASTAKNESKNQRNVSSLMPRPSTPKPTAVDYTVQVASYKTIKEAERHSQKLIDKGFPAFPVKAMINGKEWYRVTIGSFKTRKQAVMYEQQLKKQAVVKNTFVQKIKRLEK